MVELPLEIFGATEVLTFVHYVLMSNKLMLQLLYF